MLGVEALSPSATVLQGETGEGRSPAFTAKANSFRKSRNALHQCDEGKQLIGEMVYLGIGRVRLSSCPPRTIGSESNIQVHRDRHCWRSFYFRRLPQFLHWNYISDPIYRVDKQTVYGVQLFISSRVDYDFFNDNMREFACMCIFQEALIRTVLLRRFPLFYAASVPGCLWNETSTG